MTEIINFIFYDYTLRNVVLGASVLGLVSGALGSFAFLRKESLMGDVVAHSALLGITGIFLLFYSMFGIGIRSELLLMAGAVVSGLIAMLFVSKITSSSRIKNDSAMGIMLAIFFGGGMFLLTMIQQSSIPNKAGLSSYIFGSAATMSQENVTMMTILGFISILIMLIFWKEFKIHTFDKEFTHTSGFSVKFVDTLIISMIVIAIVIGLQAVGVILMVAMIVTPASSARQWTNSLWKMVLTSSIFGMISGLGGAIASSMFNNLPTGPTIVLIASTIFILSILFSPKRGLIANIYRRIKNNRKIHISLVLTDLYMLNINHDLKTDCGHSSKVLRTMNKESYNALKSLKILSQQGYVKETTLDNWVLTEKGKEKAITILNEKGALID